MAFRGPLGCVARPAALRALPLLLALAAGCRGGPIKLGIAGAFSDPAGAPMRLAARLAAEEINAAGGVGGRQLLLVERDDYTDPDSAVGVANDLYQSDVSAVVGHLFSGTTMAAAPVYNSGRNPLVALSPSSSAPDVTTAGPYTFRICPSDLAHGAALARWADDRLGLKRAAVLYLNNDYGRGIRSTFIRDFIQRQGEIVSSDPYLGDAPPVGPYLDRLARDKRAQLLLVAGNRLEAEEILRQARARGITIPLMGGDGLEGIEQAGALSEGVYVSTAYLPLIASPANRRFIAAWKKKYPEAPPPNQPAAATYDAVYLLREVFARAGDNRAAVRRALEAVGHGTPAFEGVTGRIAFDSMGDVSNAQVYVGVVHGGRIVLAGGL